MVEGVGNELIWTGRLLPHVRQARGRGEYVKIEKEVTGRSRYFREQHIIIPQHEALVGAAWTLLAKEVAYYRGPLPMIGARQWTNHFFVEHHILYHVFGRLSRSSRKSLIQFADPKGYSPLATANGTLS
jgi:hypothetical protein